jgi:hypothetical protein
MKPENTNLVLGALPMLVGGILGVVVVLTWGFRKALRARRRFWSRDKGHLLRPPGHTLAEKHSDHGEAVLRPIFALFMGSGIIGAVLWTFGRAWYNIQTSDPLRARLETEGWVIFTDTPKFWPTILSLLSGLIGGIAAVVWGRYRFLDWLRDEYRLRTGLRGERAVAEEMQPAVRAGYFLFHDIPTNADCNIDHAIVGKGGVFVIETKARSKPESNDGKSMEAIVDGKRIRFTGGGVESKAMNQAEALANWLSDSLSRSTGTRVDVRPVVALPGWFVRQSEPSNVLVRNPEYFAKELVDAPQALSPDQITRIAYQLEQWCRDVPL